MARLVIRLNQTASSAGPAGEMALSADVVARISLVIDADGEIPSAPARFERLVSIGGSPCRIDVSPGVWTVELALPSGELMSRQIRIAGAGDDHEVSFELGGPPEAWLAWQFMEGSVPERAQYEAVLNRRGKGALQSPRGVLPNARTRIAGATRLSATRMFDTPVVMSDAFAVAGRKSLPQAASQVSLLRFGNPASSAADAAADRFNVALSHWRDLVSGLRLETRIKDLPGVREDPDFVFRRGGEDAWHQTWTLTDMPEGEFRRFALVVTSWAIELVSLPLPWNPGRDIVDRSVLELVIDKSEVSRPSRTNVTLRERDVFGLLSYLKTGALSLAGYVAEHSGQGDSLLVALLSEKRRNPLAACAAGYALLAATDLREERSWYPWFQNLSDWFDWVPDGALLQGRLLHARRGTSPTTPKDAFLRAFERGLPFYALGLEWLLEGLRQFDDDPRCVEAAELVRQVSLRSDVSQVFTVLRFQRPTDFEAED